MTVQPSTEAKRLRIVVIISEFISLQPSKELSECYQNKHCDFSIMYTCEPGHEKMCLMSYPNNKGADQSAHPRSLISAFVVHCLDSIISLDSTAEISRL